MEPHSPPVESREPAGAPWHVLELGAPRVGDPESGVLGTSPPNSTPALTERKSNGSKVTSQASAKVEETIKTFGHRYLTDKSMILVSLGSMDMRKSAQAVNLDHIPMTNASSTQLDTALSIVVSAKGADGEPEIFDLPVQDNIATEPIIFHASDASSVKILFDLVPTYAGNHERIVGRGAALLQPDDAREVFCIQPDHLSKSYG